MTEIGINKAIKDMMNQKRKYLNEYGMMDYSGIAKSYDLAIEALKAYPIGRTAQMSNYNKTGQTSTRGYVDLAYFRRHEEEE